MIIYLIRHGEAAHAWDKSPDPELSKNGHQQARNLSDTYLPLLNSTDFQLVTSPLLRAQETAIPFQKALNILPIINTNFAEVPSPGIALADRRNWLKALFSKKVTELEQPQLDWRNNIISGIQSLEKNTLIFSHFMTINAIVGWIRGSEQVVSYYPNYCSITKIEKVDNQFFIRTLGEELSTVIQ